MKEIAQRSQMVRRAMLAGLVVGLLVPGAGTAATPWAKVSTPSQGPTEVIGGASNGCIGGAETLPATGPGYVSIRRYRNRYYGHPSLIQMIETVGRLHQRQRDDLIMIGDLSQPRGGRMSSSHRSHQNGLDVDIWFTLVSSASQTRRFNNAPDPVSMVRQGGKSVSAAWGPEQKELLETVAEQSAVDRIFVNPAIKRELCETTTGDRSWLRKIRPWWGHDAHFHVRLTCPRDSGQCAPQSPVPTGDGCGSELAWWFKDHPPSKKSKPTPEAAPPAACYAILRDS